MRPGPALWPSWSWRAQACLGLIVLGLLALGGAPVRTPAAAEEAVVEAKDDFFRPEVVRVPVGATVRWPNVGRNPHTVTADDGRFDSGLQAPGQAFAQTFTEPGVYRYYCLYHGAAGGRGMAGIVLVGDVELPSRAGGVGRGREPPPAGPGRTLRVPAEFPTIQEAVDAAQPGDLVLVAPGVYHESVRVFTPFLTIRGADRNAVILDGEFKWANGIHVVEADGVALENLTARHYQLNGFYWSGVFGYRGSYLTAYNNGDYGLYAFDSVYGQFDHSYASGHPDSGFYIGQCYPCHAVITDVLAENNALGYSGTNAGGSLIIANSEWRYNLSGIVPNTLDSELLPPQRETTIVGNYVHDNNNRSAPTKRLQWPTFGIGILVPGGVGNVIAGNLVEDHRSYGISIPPNLDQNFWIAERNQVVGNVVRRSGIADLALAAPSGRGNCFGANRFQTSQPPAIELLYGCGRPVVAGGGDLAATLGPLFRLLQALGGDYPQNDWRTQPAPPPQPNLPDALTAPPRPAIPEVAVPEPVAPRGAETLATADDGRYQDREVTMLGFALDAPWWGLLIGLYGYLLPLFLYSAWISIAVWDLLRQERASTGRRIGWLAVILLVPFLGPVLYYALGRSPIPAALRLALVGGGLASYLLFAALGALLAS